MRSIAIVGEFCSGKTTLADYLVEHHDYTRVSFANRLKEVCARVYNDGKPIEKNVQYKVVQQDSEITLSGRQILQQFGQSVKALDRDFWIRWLFNDLDNNEAAGLYRPGSYVTDDCRFPYEADALRSRGFAIVRLSTPLDVRMERYEHLYGRKPSVAELSHPSEVEARKIDADIRLDGTKPVEELATVVIEHGELLAAA